MKIRVKEVYDLIYAQDKNTLNGHSTYPCIRHGHGAMPVQKSRGNNCAAVPVTGQYLCRNHGHMKVGRSIARYILVTIKVSLLKSEDVHRICPSNANVIIIFCIIKKRIPSCCNARAEVTGQ